MKNEKLLNAMGEIDDELICDALRDTGRKKRFLRLGSLAAVLLLCIGAGIFGFRIGTLKNNGGDPEASLSDIPNTSISEKNLQESETRESYGETVYTAKNSLVILDVNPSIALTVDAEEKIVSAEGLNEDGKAVLKDMDLVGVDMTVAVNAVIGSMLQKGYLNDLQNAILVSVENEDAETSSELQERVSALVGSALQTGNLEGSVLSQTLSDTSDLEQMALDYHISLGKAALIQEVTAQDPTLSAEKLAPLSITEIALISQSKNLSTQTLTQNGSVSDKAYINQDTAMEIAYGHANVKAEDAQLVKVEFDSEDGVMVYEVEFRAGTVKYEFDIDARTGQIVKYEAENKGNAADTWQPSGEQQSSDTPPAGYIGEEAAKETALAYAGISPDSVNYINAWLEYDDGHPEHYEVEFAVGSIEYKYEIGLHSCTVLAHEMENHGHHDTNSYGHHSEHGSTPYPAGDIGEEAAKEAALSHAGLTASQVRKLKADYDYDNGIAVYEVEFEYNDYDYEYKIDAATGTVLEYEIDD